MSSPPTRRDTTLCSNHRTEDEEKNGVHQTPNTERRKASCPMDRRWPCAGGHRSRVAWESGRETVRAGLRSFAPKGFNTQRSTPNAERPTKDESAFQPGRTTA